ncbi:MAG: TIR domain-containing protein [Nanoarchaeota archaeon]|nr:TIR domain-containing protein [Nanoarchaeota archaeon]
MTSQTGTLKLSERTQKEYDIALSFAGEERVYVYDVAKLLRDKGVKVFYDEFEEATFWGKNLYEYLSDVYQNKAHFTVMFISKAYSKKLWPNHERQAAQACAFQEAKEYILPARFDNTKIPGVLPTIGYISLIDRTPQGLVDIILKKLVKAGITVPSETLRRNTSTIETPLRIEPMELLVRVKNYSGQPIEGAAVVALADNNTTLDAITNREGLAVLSVKTRRMYSVMVAHTDYPATVYEQLDPTKNLEVQLSDIENIGSVVIQGTGYIPGLKGRLNPILDTSDRTYIYADNIAVNGCQQQPVPFIINTPFEMEDSAGNIFSVTVKLIAGRTTLLQYVKPRLVSI